MASNSQNSGPGDSSSADQIPLQDLTRQNAPEERGRSRTNSIGGGGVFSRQSLLRRGSRRQQYHSIAEQSPIDLGITPTNAYDHEDPSALSQAMSFGISFNNPRQSISGPSLGHGFDDTASDLDNVPLDSYDSYSRSHDFTSPLPNVEDDTTGLTDPRYLQPISGAPGSDIRRSNDSSFQSVNFDNGSRLGDDLHIESAARPTIPLLIALGIQWGFSAREFLGEIHSIEREESNKDARMEGPPALPATADFSYDSIAPELPPRETRASGRLWRYRNNPFRGKALGFLGPDHPLRLWLCDVLVHPVMEPFILVIIIIQTILLIIESTNSVSGSPMGMRWGHTPFDYVFLAIFIIYTLEIVAKVLVSGFLFNATEYSTLNRSLGIRKAIAEKGRNLITPYRQNTTSKKVSFLPAEPQASIIRTFTGINVLDAGPTDDPLQKRRVRLAHRAFLRHSFNRLDFVAVVAFWISFLLSISGLESAHQLYIFRMLSCLRILRLLALTNGTSVILRSLKRAAPLLVHVAFLIGFFWLLFAIVGIQSFKSSLRRTCVWIGTDGQDNFTLNDPEGTVQFCGGYLDSSGEKKPWLTASGDVQGSSPKGYICPMGSLCVEGENPYNATVSFDNIAQSIELVFVIMSSNTFTDLLYYTCDSDYLASALFFAFGLVILSLWLVNLLVAVITHSFQVIREESKRSAFAVQQIDTIEEDETSTRPPSFIKRLYDKTEWFWVLLIIFDLVIQALRSSTMGDDRERVINTTETVVTLVLLAEIILRFVSDWRSFHRSRRNWFDLFLVVITCLIQIPPIKNSGRPYTVMTLFQILRVYRVVLLIPVTRKLIMIVFRNTVGLVNLIFFLFLMTFLAAIFATQLFRSQIPDADSAGNSISITFGNIYNSFLGMYQILSSENWTTILYNATTYTTHFNTAWISASFVILWFIVANFIILNMFIAVIQESFDVSEDEKRLQQVKAFLEQKHVGQQTQGNLALSKILRLGRDSIRYKDPLDHGPAALEMLLKDAVVREFLDEAEDEKKQDEARRHPESTVPDTAAADAVEPGALSQIWTKITSLVMGREPNPFYSKLQFSRAYEELDPRTMAREVVSASEARKRAQREYLVKHPNYNKSLYLFGPHDPIRKVCQRIVGPGRGNQRVEGVDPYKPVWYAFSAFIYAAIVAMVLLACITTPLYQKKYFSSDRNWFVYTDMGFAVVFTIEAVIKVIADGFFWTPNAYFRSSWGFIDGVVLVTLWINVGSSLVKDYTLSRPIGAFKALRALRLLNVSDSAKDTFHSVIIVGGMKVLAAASVSMSFLIPFAIYGVNLFNGQMVSCNDSNFSGNLTACINEYPSSPYNWEVLAPRVASNPYYSFDNFGDSLFILFQIVSQEGWIDVQDSAMSIIRAGIQPQEGAAPENGLFFVVFNLLGAVFVLTLFVSVFMRNYTEQTGVAFLTAEQRSWLELRKLLRQISPRNDLSMPAALAGKNEPHAWELTRSIIIFFFILIFLANVIIRLVGLGWHRFVRSSWDLYSILAVPGAFVTIILNIAYPAQAVLELNKLFLVAVALLLIPRNNQLDQLFKTAAASLPVIGNLLATWFVLFLVFGIAMNQSFGLTKFGSQETNNLNFRDIPKSLILLFRCSCGEGWNEIMEDFATMEPPFCTYDDDFLSDDCGSAAWARTLFIAWNIISMYIFVSLFVSLIFESFSYVYQRSSGLYAISREEIRRFKQAWAEYDPDGTGFISKEQFPRLLGELSGVFAMRIYEEPFTVGAILEQCRTDNPQGSVYSLSSSSMPFRSRESFSSAKQPKTDNVIDGVDIKKLARIVEGIPVDEIRRKRLMLNTFYEEVLVSADPDRGISFHQILMILAHYKIITDSKSLRLEEFLRRRARLQRVEEAVRRNTVISFFDTLYWSRRFRRSVERRKEGRMAAPPQFTVPEIFVENPVDSDDFDAPAPGTMTPQNQPDAESPFTPMLSPSSSSHRRAESTPTGRLRDLPRLDTSLTGRTTGNSTPTDWSSFSPSRTPRHMYGDRASFDLADRSQSPGTPGEGQRQNSAMSVQDVMSSLETSAWGESIRRSFTKRRSDDRKSDGQSSDG
ncbi:hypothetical protein N7470_009316 [Penicillium chermesinum]|nr:hypothetical protein N7470_009316 [Penicillium chermesinum]